MTNFKYFIDTELKNKNNEISKRKLSFHCFHLYPGWSVVYKNPNSTGESFNVFDKNG